MTQTTLATSRAVDPEDEGWKEARVSHLLLAEEEAGRGPIPRQWAGVCARRLRSLRDELRAAFVGLGPEASASTWGGGWLVDWLLAAVVARENALLLGSPGVAKTEMVERLFELLGLATPTANGAHDSAGGNLAFRAWWQQRADEERGQQKYFRYLLSRFTQPEELFGPVEISLLRQGVLVRVNFGLMTGPGVRAAFLDEIFKASSSILNSLLTLSNERRYFNWGGMEKSDLITLIGASNELPGGLHQGAHGLGSAGEDFNTLYAFVDRFPIRLLVPAPSGFHETEPAASTLAEAAQVAIRREAHRFTHGARFAGRKAGLSSLNDVLLLGRAAMQQEEGAQDRSRDDSTLFEPAELARFRTTFLSIACDLQPDGTDAERRQITWTISPRKLKALYKIALAHALITDDAFDGRQHARAPGPAQLSVLRLIWDSPVARDDLERRVVTGIETRTARPQPAAARGGR